MSGNFFSTFLYFFFALGMPKGVLTHFGVNMGHSVSRIHPYRGVQGLTEIGFGVIWDIHYFFVVDR